MLGWGWRYERSTGGNACEGKRDREQESMGRTFRSQRRSDTHERRKERETLVGKASWSHTQANWYRLGRMGRKNKGSGKSELKAKVTGLLTVILFAASKVLSHAFSCFESHRNFGGIESRYYLYFIEKKLKRHLPQCQEHGGCLMCSFVHSFHVLLVLSDHLMNEHI